jgi:hypothetical protein
MNAIVFHVFCEKKRVKLCNIFYFLIFYILLTSMHFYVPLNFFAMISGQFSRVRFSEMTYFVLGFSTNLIEIGRINRYTAMRNMEMLCNQR